MCELKRRDSPDAIKSVAFFGKSEPPAYAGGSDLIHANADSGKLKIRIFAFISSYL